MSKRIMFTGGSGKAGRYAIQYLVEQGHQVLNLDSVRLDNPKVRTLITDITDSGQVFNALTSCNSWNSNAANGITGGGHWSEIDANWTSYVCSQFCKTGRTESFFARR